ncbi:MAG: transglutaminase domain-containing protein [Clostridia bacterium]|nr:transglutaminase domain-containing protein [Clostridia bacterium]
MKNTPFNYDDLALLTVELPDSIKNLRYSGRFDHVLCEIDRLLSDNTHPNFDPIMVRRLELERFLAVGLAHDYQVPFEDMVENFREKYPSFTEKNLVDLVNSGHADFMVKTDGIYFENAAYSNLRECCGNYLAKLENPDFVPSPNPNGEQHEAMAYMREHGRSSWRYRIREWIEPDEQHERPGETVRIWLPFPAITPEQSSIRLIESSRPVYITDGPIRTAYAEFEYHAGDRLEITLEFTNTAVYHDLHEEDVTGEIPAEVLPYLAEVEPHIVFTPYLKKLAAYLTEGTDNPLVKARRIYDYVTSHVKYSYTREYRLFDNIPMYAAVNGRGDCGVQALLFITLCRIAGVPARWQSGNAVHPPRNGNSGRVGSHDWALFYIAPYGWLYCDPSYGGGAKRRGDTEAWNWYFGNLDPHRYVCCTEFQRQLDPAKTFMRLDPYDNQSGEIEYSDECLSYSDVNCSKKLLEAEQLP